MHFFIIIGLDRYTDQRVRVDLQADKQCWTNAISIQYSNCLLLAHARANCWRGTETVHWPCRNSLLLWSKHFMFRYVDVYTYMYTYIHAYLHTYVRIYMHVYMLAYIQVYIHTCVRMYYNSTYVATYIHMRTYAYIHTPTHRTVTTYNWCICIYSRWWVQAGWCSWLGSFWSLLHRWSAKERTFHREAPQHICCSGKKRIDGKNYWTSFFYWPNSSGNHHRWPTLLKY